MIQALKVFRTISLNVLVVGLAILAMENGGNPTVIPMGAFSLLAVVNGFEYSDWAAFRQAYQEAASQRNSSKK